MTIEEMPTENVSQYDSSRKTVGAIYRETQLKGPRDNIEVGNMTEEIIKGLVDDINECILSKPLGPETPFFIMVHEKKDLQMPSQILRRIITFKFRPWPEDDTVVFLHDPLKFVTYFCWCLPHWSEMDNMLANQLLYEPELINEIKRWKNMDMTHFGFMKTDDRKNWTMNPHFKDKPIEEFAKRKKYRNRILIA